MIQKLNRTLTVDMLLVFSALIGLAFRSLLIGVVSLLPALFLKDFSRRPLHCAGRRPRYGVAEPITAEDVDAAVATITEFAGDAKKVVGYCEISKQLDALKEDNEKGAEEVGGKMDAYLVGLGEEVEEASGTADEVTADSEEEKKINAALETLDKKCGG